MKLYLIRHGQSEANLHHRHAGWSQTPLTPQGVEDARKAGELLKEIPFDKIFASDLPRTRMTCETALPGCCYEPTPLVREIHVGDLADQSFADCTSKWGEEYTVSQKQRDFTKWNGENLEIFCFRIRQFMTQMEKSSYEKVAVFTHGGFIQHMLELVLGVSLDRKTFATDNCGIFIFEFKDGQWQLLQWNVSLPL